MSGATPAAPVFPTLVQRFFLEGLVAQRNTSTRTIAAYRDSFRLLLAYIRDRQGLEPSDVHSLLLAPRFSLASFLTSRRTVATRSAHGM